MADTPVQLGMAKAVSGTAASLIGGSLAQIVSRLIQVHYPNFLDPDTLQAIDVLLTAGVTGAATYLTPHTLGGSSS